MEQNLRPVERRVRKLTDQGLSDPEIAWRFRRSPGYIRQVRRLSEVPRPDGDARSRDELLRPLERCVLRWRQQGADYPELAARFRRHPSTLRRIEALAHHKLNQN